MDYRLLSDRRGGVAFGAGVKDELNSIENAFGTNLDDVIRGSQGSNYLAGGRGDDYIYGFGGDDTIAPGYGADFVSGGEGFDTLSLRIHSEFEEMERGTHTVYLYGDGSGRVERLTENSTIETTVFYGIERVFGSNGIDIIHGSSGNDQISGNATFEGSSGDKIYGYAGDDILAGNGGARLYGGIGNDTVTLQWQVVDPITDNLGFWVNLEAGRTFQMFWRDGLDASGPNANSYLDSIENVIGSNYDDLIFGDEKDNFLTGVHGDDDIFAGDGRDFLVGGKGYNKLDGGAGVDAVSYGGLTDAYGVNVRLDGGFAFERIAHSSAGHDTQKIQVDSKGLALSEGDVVTLKIAGYSVSVTVDAYNAASHRWPGLVLQTLKDSSALGNLFDVTDPVGSSWNNYITANYAFENVEVSLSVNGVDMSGTHVTQVRSSDGIGAVDELKGIENVFGSQGSDNIYGADDGNVLVGAGGNDKIYGFAGNDVLSGGEGADVLYGGDGVDTLVYNIGDTRNTGFEIDLLGDTTYNIDFSLNRISVEDTFYDFENATGGAGNDLIKGDDFANILAGAGAHDTIEGRGGDDVLIGGEGSDVLDGGDGMDIASYSDVKEVGIVANLENGVVVEKLDEGTGVFLSQVQVDSSGMTLEAGDELTFTFAGRSVSVTVDDYSAASWRWPGLIVDAVANDPVLSALFTTTTNSGSSWNNYITAKYPILGNAIGGVDLRPTLQLKDGDTASTSNLNSLLNWTYSHTAEGQNDVLKSIEGLFGTEQDDVIFGSTGDDVVSGSGGNDLIYGNGGNDALSGGAGSDTIVLGDGSDTSIATFTIKTGDHDILVLDGGTLPSIVLEAAGGLPTGFSGGYGGNILTALDGDSDPDNDYRLEIQYTGTEAGSGLNFSDITFKGTGSDGDEWFWYDFHTVILNAEGGNDTIYGADNDDQLDGGSGNDQLYGLAGNDNLLGGSGDDAVVGGAGNDTLVGGLGADWLNGGEGIDLADYSQDIEELNVESELGFEIDLTNGRAARRTHADGYEDTLINIENVYGTHLSDHIIGDTNENLLDGRGGDDIIESKGGLTTIIDGEGSDTVTGIGTGDDTYIFTANKGDTDTLNNHGGSASITVRADVSEYSGGTISFSLSQAGQYTLALAQDYSLVINSSDTLSQQDLSFEITGTDETDTIINVFGDSLILGLGGDDTLHGNWNVDRLFGGDGDDYLEGNQGNDTLFGEAGADRLNGGTGDDYFSGGGGQDLIIGGDGYDIIDYSLDETDAREGIRVDVTLTTETQRWNDGWKVGHGWGYWELEDTFSGIEGIIGTDHDDTYSTVFRDGENAVSFRGGFGTDTLEIGTVDENIDYVSVNLAGAAAAAIDQDGVTHGLTILYDVENVIGSQKAEFVSDTLADNTYQGNGGQDIFFLVGGADTVDGGADNDTVSFANLQHSVTVSLPWSESGIGSYSYTENSGSITSGTLRSVEAVIGTIFNDTITSGYHYSNTINGGQGDDDITLLSADNVVEETDRIVFNDNFGNDVVTGFQNGIDQIVFDLSDATNPTITSSQSGADTLVIVGTEGTILLKDFQADDFDSSDYSFVA